MAGAGGAGGRRPLVRRLLTVSAGAACCEYSLAGALLRADGRRRLEDARDDQAGAAQHGMAGARVHAQSADAALRCTGDGGFRRATCSRTCRRASRRTRSRPSSTRTRSTSWSTSRGIVFAPLYPCQSTAARVLVERARALTYTPSRARARYEWLHGGSDPPLVRYPREYSRGTQGVLL